MYKESEGVYHISVKAYSNFFKLPGPAQKAGFHTPGSDVIVDFSLAEFVDYSVLEQLQDYLQSLRDKGGDLEIIGLDDLGASTDHPLAHACLPPRYLK
ncbi:MAG: hypothetical protein U5L96_05415 [Owenweeksia sp.]|nr:hypothetical protein [Owenweeksia sp.]